MNKILPGNVIVSLGLWALLGTSIVLNMTGAAIFMQYILSNDSISKGDSKFVVSFTNTHLKARLLIIISNTRTRYDIVNFL